MRNSLYLLLFIAACTGFIACRKNLDKPGIIGHSEEKVATTSTDPCVTPEEVLLKNNWGVAVGKVIFSNDADNVILDVVSSNSDFKISAVKVTYGDWQHVYDALIDVDSECEGPSIADIDETFSAPGNSTEQLTFSIPVDQECVWYQVHVTLVRRDLGGNVIETKCAWTGGTESASSYNWNRFGKYCIQTPCPPPPPPPPGDCGQLRTQTPGGWGAEPNGNNPGTYLHAHFGAAFPNGLQIGCGNNTILLTGAQKITDLLPTGGKAATISGNLIDPTSIKNVLVGHLVALTLSTTFDAYYEDFGQAGMQLGYMIIGGNGPFAGKSVNEFMQIANDVIGGCSNAYTVNQVLEMATLINENYTDGLIDNKVLICPEENINY